MQTSLDVDSLENSQLKRCKVFNQLRQPPPPQETSNTLRLSLKQQQHDLEELSSAVAELRNAINTRQIPAPTADRSRSSAGMGSSSRQPMSQGIAHRQVFDAKLKCIEMQMQAQTLSAQNAQLTFQVEQLNRQLLLMKETTVPAASVVEKDEENVALARQLIELQMAFDKEALARRQTEQALDVQTRLATAMEKKVLDLQEALMESENQNLAMQAQLDSVLAGDAVIVSLSRCDKNTGPDLQEETIEGRKPEPIPSDNTMHQTESLYSDHNDTVTPMQFASVPGLRSNESESKKFPIGQSSMQSIPHIDEFVLRAAATAMLDYEHSQHGGQDRDSIQVQKLDAYYDPIETIPVKDFVLSKHAEVLECQSITEQSIHEERQIDKSAPEQADIPIPSQQAQSDEIQDEMQLLTQELERQMSQISETMFKDNGSVCRQVPEAESEAKKNSAIADLTQPPQVITTSTDLSINQQDTVVTDNEATSNRPEPK